MAICIFVCAILVSPLYVCAQEVRRIGQAAKFASGPEIDGRLDDECWKNLKAFDKFTCVITRTGPANAPTRAYVGYDNKYLYVAFQCDEPEMELLKKYIAKKAIGPFDESVEIFIDANRDRDTYYQLRVDVLGRREVRYGMEIVSDFSWQAHAVLADGGFTVEAAIPLSSFLKARISAETPWGFNVNRMRMIDPPTEFSAWSNTAGGFHAPGKFGLLVFSGYKDFFSSYFKKHSAQMKKKLERLYKEYPVSTAPLDTLMDEFVSVSRQYHQMVETSNLETEEEALALFKEFESTRKSLEDILSKVRLEVIKGEFK